MEPITKNFNSNKMKSVEVDLLLYDCALLLLASVSLHFLRKIICVLLVGLAAFAIDVICASLKYMLGGLGVMD